jgi:hypothetical protein
MDGHLLTRCLEACAGTCVQWYRWTDTSEVNESTKDLNQHPMSRFRIFSFQMPLAPYGVQLQAGAKTVGSLFYVWKSSVTPLVYGPPWRTPASSIAARASQGRPKHPDRAACYFHVNSFLSYLHIHRKSTCNTHRPPKKPIGHQSSIFLHLRPHMNHPHRVLDPLIIIIIICPHPQPPTYQNTPATSSGVTPRSQTRPSRPCSCLQRPPCRASGRATGRSRARNPRLRGARPGRVTRCWSVAGPCWSGGMWGVRCVCLGRGRRRPWPSVNDHVTDAATVVCIHSDPSSP